MGELLFLKHTAICLLGSLIIYIATHALDLKYKSANKTNHKEQLLSLLEEDEEIKLIIPRQNAPISIILPIALIYLLISGMLIVTLTLLSHAFSESVEISSLIATALLIQVVMIFDVFNQDLASLVLTNKRLLYSNIKYNRPPKSVTHSEIKSIDTFI